jgi:hypothetical protein
MGLLDRQLIHETVTPLESVVAEMGSLEETQIEIPVDSALLTKIKAKDENPQFVTVEVKSGKSKNRRNWTPEILEKIAQVVNEKRPVGYLGHIPRGDEGHLLPPPQTLWIGAKTERRGDHTVLYIKGYNRSPEIRDYVDLGMVDAVSIYGDSTLRPGSGGYDVVDFSLESIDWARKGKNGMPSRVVSISAEMEEGGRQVVDGRDIAAISEQELRTHNPSVVELIESKASSTLQTKIGEMEEEAKKTSNLTEIVNGIKERLKVESPEKILETLDEFLQTIKGAKASDVKAFITSVIEGKVATPRGQKLVARLVGEMEDISELTDETKKTIETRITDAIENDEDVKAVVGEMKDDGKDTKEKTGEMTGGATLGVRSRTHSTGNSSEGKDGIVKDNERMTVKTVKFGE